MSAASPPPMPTTFELGPFTYTISTDPAELTAWQAKDGQPDLAGRYDEATLSITLDGTHVVGYQREVLLHETLHAVFAVTGLEHDHDEMAEEKLIRRLCPTLLELLRRNPGLVAWLVAP